MNVTKTPTVSITDQITNGIHNGLKTHNQLQVATAVNPNSLRSIKIIAKRPQNPIPPECVTVVLLIIF